MAARRRVIGLAIEEEDLTGLMSIARSRTEPASRVERAQPAAAAALGVSPHRGQWGHLGPLTP